MLLPQIPAFRFTEMFCIIVLDCLPAEGTAIMAKHLSLSERAFIERALVHEKPFADIAKALNRSATTISREVRNHRVFVHRWRDDKNDCLAYQTCLRRNLCPTETIYSCIDRCKFCREYDCRTLCPSYQSPHCPKLEKPPYVCTGCEKQKSCKRNHAYYTAHRANAAYKKELRDARIGIRTDPERLLEIGELLSPLIAKGQSLNHILATHKDEIGLSEKTIYNYIDANVFSVKNIDLPKKVVYRQRKTKPVLTKKEYQCRRGRTFEDFSQYVEDHPGISVVEMDTVKSARGCKRTLLTFVFRNTNFMLVFLLKDGTQTSVLAVMDFLSDRLGLDTFRALFPVILTDNGVEFQNPDELEHTPNNCQRTRIFYCDPQASWQKPHVEKNHVLLRRIIPKGTSFKELTKAQVTLATNHVNSVARELFDNKTPFEIFIGENEKKLLDLLDLSPVPPDEVCLKPALLKRKPN